MTGNVEVVASPQFASLWERVVSASHVQLIATMQGDPDALVAIGTNGTISIQLGPVIESVKAALVERGINIAAGLPPIDKTIVVATAVLSVALVVIAHVRSWERFAWMPLVGFAFAMSGHVAGAETIAFYGGVLTVVLALAHSIQEERRRRYHPVAH